MFFLTETPVFSLLLKNWNMFFEVFLQRVLNAGTFFFVFFVLSLWAWLSY